MVFLYDVCSRMCSCAHDVEYTIWVDATVVRDICVLFVCCHTRVS